ncbi:MAG: hypothetical protein ACRDKE_01945 [Solirubrobacterales bacterium]
MTVEQPQPAGQIHRVRAQQLLCGAAILLFVGFFWSRSLHWATLVQSEVKVFDAGFQIRPDKLHPFDGKLWGSLDTPIWLYAFVLIGSNLLYIVAHRVIDQLIPAIANTLVGLALAGLTTYFILAPGDALGHEMRSGGISWHWELADGAYPALAFAVGIIGVGIAQIAVRQKAKAEDAASRQPNVQSAEIPASAP